MSFTSGTLLYHESLTIVELYRDLADWNVVREKVLADNRLQLRTLNASKRIYREITSRLRLLTADELTLLCTGSRHDQLYLLWLAVCKRYRFIRLFAEQVLREKFLRLDMVITYDDYDRFFYQMVDTYPEVEGVAQRTQTKQRQVIFKMMREADLITDEGLILPAILSPALIERIHCDNPAYFAIYPVAEADVQIYNTQHESR